MHLIRCSLNINTASTSAAALSHASLLARPYTGTRMHHAELRRPPRL